MTRSHVAPASPLMVRLAHISALSPVLSSLWRLPLIFGVSMGLGPVMTDDLASTPFAGRAAYLIGLGVLTDGLAFLAIGLVRPWGEVFPTWMPVVGGRAVPLGFAGTAALLGGLGACAFGLTMAVGMPANVDAWDGWSVLMYACYAPLALWGPTLLIVTADYIRRRRAASRHTSIDDLSDRPASSSQKATASY
ncbi:hypothetical protein PZ938_03960 [Luteipulveratus sp. YIM 133132]|uniref:hypothetical protein n=1 Tax=Luteipulveratus flavus TaxID=3031728 RepID=UPI0023B1EF52|nr:hypothetical protein [Luteipulveratus sp. YIM 133132]MDE9364749.1 hypothetical protein [Luteipulveratus sp. YIM 133132]